jgi:hypothetical protein
MRLSFSSLSGGILFYFVFKCTPHAFLPSANAISNIPSARCTMYCVHPLLRSLNINNTQVSLFMPLPFTDNGLNVKLLIGRGLGQVHKPLAPTIIIPASAFAATAVPMLNY